MAEPQLSARSAKARDLARRLATRNLPDFETTGLELICPWDF
jgi:hypothetical protein